jgi:hypothetical protein
VKAVFPFVKMIPVKLEEASEYASKGEKFLV